MTIDVETQAGIHIVKIVGDISGGEDCPLVERVTDLISAGSARILLDMSGVQFVNSAGLADLVRVTGQANVQEARVVLACVGPFITGLFETTRLNRFFDVVATVEAGVETLKE